MTWAWMDAWTDSAGMLHAVCLVDERGETVAETSAHKVHDIVVSHPNAHLIAAAPDLLEALRHLARGPHEWSVPADALAYIERHIAKAEPK